MTWPQDGVPTRAEAAATPAGPPGDGMRGQADALDDAATPAPARGPVRRLIRSGLVLVLVAGATVYGGDFFGVRDRIQPIPRQPAPVAHGITASGGQPVLASTPYWQPVAILQGATGSTTQTVTIAAAALQWRVSWTCAAGGRLAVLDGAAGSKPLVDVRCPGSGIGYGSTTGSVPLDVVAGGSWRLSIEQQVDVPIQQPPLPAMTTAGAAVVATGSFYGVDQQGSGMVTVYRLATGAYAVRLDNFYVTPNAELDLRFSTPVAPHSDGDVSGAPVAHIGDLIATAGSMNFEIPAGVQPSHYRSVTVWCVQLQTAYAAATLASAR